MGEDKLIFEGDDGTFLRFFIASEIFASQFRKSADIIVRSLSASITKTWRNRGGERIGNYSQEENTHQIELLL